jgi:predicted hydrocarbon binding protein
MAKIKIPESEHEILKKISELQDGTLAQLIDAIKGIDASQIQLDLSEKIAMKVDSIKKSDLVSILRTIRGLYAFKARKKIAAKEVAEIIGETIGEANSKMFPPENLPRLKENLQKLLSIGSVIEVTAKAMDVMTDQSNIFCGVKILSDIRPVFKDSAEGLGLDAAVVIHNLKLSYHNNGDHKEFFVAMNADDVRKMKEVMERAEKKNEYLKAFIQKSQISYFEDKD